MTATHRWSFPINCPKCKAASTVSVLEEAGPPFSSPPRRTFTALGRFAMQLAGAEGIECLDCNRVFPSGY